MDIFRLFFIGILLTAFAPVGVLSAAPVGRGDPGDGRDGMFSSRLLLAVPFYLSMLAYAVNPAGWRGPRLTFRPGCAGRA
jgi:hypothetical protein